MRIKNHSIEIQTNRGISIHDVTPQIKDFLMRQAMHEGVVIVSSRHTTTALTVNENEARLLEDVKTFLEALIPKTARYLHNDIHLRNCPPDEPQNAHSHIAAMLLSSSEVIPVMNGELALGTWQSVLLFELDGPRQRRINLQLLGE